MKKSYGPGPGYARKTARQAAQADGYAAVQNIVAARPQYATRSYVPYRYGAGFTRNRNALSTRAEKKVIDTYYNATVQADGSNYALLNGTKPGSQNYDRIGRKITLKSLQIHGKLNVLSNETTTGFVIRMIIVYDKQPNGASPTYSDVIKSQDISGATSSSYSDFVNLDNRDRFEIVRDHFFQLGQFTTSPDFATGPLTVPVNEYIKLGNRETCYNAGNAGTIGDITSGAIFLFLMADDAGANSDLSFRIRFTDV